MIRALSLWLLRRRIRAQQEWRKDLIDGAATAKVLLVQCERKLGQLQSQELLLMTNRQVLKRALQG